MPDIYTTLKQKGTSNNVYPNVRKNNIPYDDTLSQSTSKFPTSAAVYKTVLTTYTSDNNSIYDYPDVTPATIAWGVGESDIEEIPNFIVELSVTRYNIDYSFAFSIHNSTLTRYSDHTVYTFTANDEYRTWILNVT